jgi:Tfp pilus assembly protein PilV
MRRARGHLLMEGLISGALMLIAITGVATGIVQAARDSAIAREDQEAFRLASNELERLRAQPLAAAAWAAGVTGPVAPPGHPDWTLTVTISDVADPSLAGVAHKRAQVNVTWRSGTRQANVETLRWVGSP